MTKTPSTPQDHAKFSPSGASRWMNCPGSLPLTGHLPRTTNNFADEGTAAHELAAWCLEHTIDPWDFEMYEMHIYDGKCATRMDGSIEVPKDHTYFSMWVVDQAMIEFIQDYLNTVADFTAVKNSTLLVEQRVNFSPWVGEDNQFGTSDAVILTPDEITIVDLKYGRGVVVAGDNPQLKIYALGAYHTYGLLADFKRVRMVISQPRVQHLSEATLTVEELLEFGEEVKAAAGIVKEAYKAKENNDPDFALAYLNPGKAQCQWCPLKSRYEGCSALDNHVAATVTDEDFIDMTGDADVATKIEEALPHVGELPEDRLSFCMDQVGLIEGWCKAVRSAVYNKLAAGEPVDGYKLVRGRKGARAWADEGAAEQLLVKSMQIKHADAYVRKLISPTNALKLLKGSKKRLARLDPYITQSEGSLSVAPVEDKRQPVELELDFEDLTVETEKEESLL